MFTDFRYALRTLSKNPGFAAAAIVTLALGIGLNVTVFSMLNALLLKPLPVPESNRLVWITGLSTGPDPVRENLTYADIVDFRSATNVFSDICGYAETPFAVRAGSQALRLTGQIVTGNYFSTLRVSAAPGRLLSIDDEERAGDEHVAVISHSLWERVFQSSPHAVGAPIEINGQPFSVVGVAPRAFSGADILSPADVWVPISAASRVMSIERPYGRASWWLRGLGRLAPGVSASQAAVVLRGLATGIAQAYPATHLGFSVRLDAVRGVNPGDQEKLGALVILPAVPLSILLIACANVANLLLARGVSRGREIAVRKALGATRWQLVRQLMVESTTLATLSGAASLLLSLWTPELLVRIAGAPLAADFTPDRRVVGFTLVISAVTALAFGLVPAFRLSRLPGTFLRAEPGATGGVAKSARFQRMLVGGQLALSLVLVIADALFIESVARARGAPVGFETQGLVTLSMDLRMQRYNDDRANTFCRALLDRAGAVAAVRSATFAAFVPLGGRVMFMPYFADGQPLDPQARTPTVAVNMVGPSFFETLRLPIRRGRAIDERDLSSTPRAVVISEAMASRLAPGKDAIGLRFSLGSPGAPSVEVVGVAANAILDEFNEAPRPIVYIPHDRRPGEISLIASTRVTPGIALKELEAAIHAIDPAVAVFESRSMAQHLADRADAERGLSRLLAVAGALALGLAALGLYGIMAYAVTRRTREIGVRVALGAQPGDVIRLFVREGTRVALAGVISGLLPGLALTFLLANVLFGVRPADPVAIVGAVAALIATALVASYLPARRALRVDPIAALRAE
jgi:putative ABC transport system permease protein